MSVRISGIQGSVPSGTANGVAYFDSLGMLASEGAFSYDAATNKLTVTGATGVAADLTGAGIALQLKSTTTTGGLQIFNSATGTTPASDGFLLSSDSATLYLYNRENGAIVIGTNNSDRWQIGATGHLLAATDATYDFGASGASRARDVWASRNVIAGTIAMDGANAIVDQLSSNSAIAIRGYRAVAADPGYCVEARSQRNRTSGGPFAAYNNNGAFTAFSVEYDGGITPGKSGTASAPALIMTGDANTGVYSAGADSLDVAAGGTRVAGFAKSGSDVQILCNGTSSTVPGYTFVGDTNTGLCYQAADRASLMAGGGNALIFGFAAGSPTLGFLGTAAVAKQTSGANLTNNVTSGGTSDQIDNWTDLTTYATDAAAIRNAVYQLARKLKQINDGLRTYGLFT